jgi:hypothetical protein
MVAGLLLFRYPGKTILFLIPAALIPLIASGIAQYAALGEFKFVYAEFGTESYLYEGSLWKTPLELDSLNLPWFDAVEAARRGIAPESYGLYLFHMTLGHHGFWSLSPVFLLSLVGLGRLLRVGWGLLALCTLLTVAVSVVLGGAYLSDRAAWAGGGRFHHLLWLFFFIPALLMVLMFWLRLLIARGGGQPMAALAWMTTVLTVVMLAFYAWNPRARNYGGSTQGLRWLFWLIPFWLLVLPKSIEAGQTRDWVRKVAILALLASVISVGYAMRNPWSHPWIQDALEHLDIYTLPR